MEFYKIRDNLPIKARLDYYYTFIYPYLSYNVVVWGGTYQNHLNPLITQHKRIIRTIASAQARDHTTPLFFQLGLLKFGDLYNYYLLIHMYKKINQGEFSVAHSVNTRNRHLATPTFHRLTLTQHSVSFRGPTAWNTLPLQLQQLPTLSKFKKCLKLFFIQKYADQLIS